MPSIPCPHCGEVACMRVGGETCINKNIPRFGGRPDSYQAEPSRARGRRGRQVESTGEEPELDANAPETPYTSAQSDIESNEETPPLDPGQVGDVTITENEPDRDASLYRPSGK